MKKNKHLKKLLAVLQEHSLRLHHFAKNLAAHPGRSPLHHSINYAAAGDRPACFARIFRKTILFIQYAG